jgi:surface carbohydrate biosynthesis protein
LVLAEVDQAAPSSRRVLICIAHLGRDLEGCCLVGYLLEKRFGLLVTYCRVSDVKRRLLEVAPDAVVLDFLGGVGSAEVSRLAKQLNVRVVVLPVAGFYGSPEEYLDAAGRRTGAAGTADCYLAWGDAARDILVGSGLLDPGQVRASGSPRFDFYRAPLNSLTERRDELLDGIGCPGDPRPLLLWATSTPEVGRDRESVVSIRSKGTAIPEEDVRRELDEQAVMFREQCLAIDDLAGRHPEWLWVVKVHPRESAAAYRPLSEGRANIRVAPPAGIRPWLMACDVLLQCASTTATEAWIIGKPVIDLALGGYGQRWAPADFAAGNHQASTLGEAEDAIHSCLRDGVPPEQMAARQAFLARHYSGADGRAGERCAAEIARLLSGPLYPDSEHERTVMLVAEEARQRRRTDQRRLASRLKSLLGIPAERSLRAALGAGLFGGGPETVPLDTVRALCAGMDRALAPQLRTTE